MSKSRRKQVSIRPLSEDDLAALPGLAPDAREAAMVFWEAADPRSPDAVRDLLRDRQDLLVAEYKARVIGVGGLHEVIEGKTGYLGPVVVAPEFRGHGIGAQLLSALLEIAFRRHRLREVRARVLGDNEDGLMLLSEAGFMPYSNEEQECPDGRRHVVVQMRIDRRSSGDMD